MLMGDIAVYLPELLDSRLGQQRRETPISSDSALYYYRKGVTPFALAQHEGNRQCKVRAYGLTTLLTRRPLRHRLKHTDSLFV